MKKILFAFILSSFITLPAFAKCNGGSLVTTNDHEFCVGPSMTWWAAFAWCEYQERHLAVMKDICSNWNGEAGMNTCPSIRNLPDKAWTANPQGSASAWSVRKKTWTGYSDDYIETKSVSDTLPPLCY